MTCMFYSSGLLRATTGIDHSQILFRLIQGLPNLLSLSFDQRCFLRLSDLESLRIATSSSRALRKLSLRLIHGSIAEGLPTPGPTGLESLWIIWDVRDSPRDPNSALRHLHSLILPSAETLVTLHVEDIAGDLSILPSSAFQYPGPRSRMQVFDYTTPTKDVSVIAMLAEMHPSLIWLRLIFSSGACWTVGLS